MELLGNLRILHYYQTHALCSPVFPYTNLDFSGLDSSHIVRCSFSNRLDIVFYIQPNLNDFSNIRYFSECGYTSMLSNSIAYASTLTAKYFSNSTSFKNVELFFESGLQVKL